MSPTLRPATIHALHGFQRRRKWLLRFRATLAALCVLMVLLVFVALLDRLTFMPDEWRHGLSYLAYAAALIAAWYLGLRFIKESRDESGAARLLETADPALRERLLSAVELAQKDESLRSGSLDFRAQLQDSVADQLSGFSVPKVLPVGLLKRWMMSLAGFAVLLVGLGFVPDLHLHGFLARAALPFANLPRPSSVRIQILNPPKGDALVPLASSVPLAIQVDGKTPKRVFVETKSDENKPVRIELTSMGASRFEGGVPVGQYSVRYRVRAGDGISAWHTLEARPRPRVIAFEKIITPPAYSHQPESKLNEDHGDVSALEGSTVKLVMKANQPIAQSVATILPALSIVKVEHPTPDQLAITLPVDGKADSWQMALTSRETQFTNDETSPWRIETLSDVPPTVTITAPREQIEARSDDVVQVSGDASDDVGLAKIELATAVNGADWKNSKIETKLDKEAHFTQPLKLATLPLKSGDALLVKLCATDLKGQMVESPPVRIVIVEDHLDPTKRAWAAQQRQLAKQAAALADQSRDFKKELEHRGGLPQRGRDGKLPPNGEADIARARQALEGVRERAEELWNQLKEASRQAPDRLAALEMNLAAKSLADLRGDHLKELDEQLHAENMDPKQVHTSINEAASKADTVANALKMFAAEHTADAVREHMEQLAPQQNRLADRAIEANRDTATRPKWQEQQRAALAQEAHAKEDLKALLDVIQDGRRRDVENVIQNLDKKAASMTGALDNAQQHQAPEFVYSQSHEMRNAANQARDASRWFADEAAQKAREFRERLQQQENPALAALNQARDRTEKAANQKNDRKGQQEPMAEQAQDKLAAAARQFKDQSEFREQNPLTNNQSALDMNRLGRALENLAQQAKQDASPENLKRIAQNAQKLAESARVLEADSMASDAHAALQDAQQTAMGQTDPEAQLPAARAAATQLKDLPNALRKAQADPKAPNDAQQAANHANWHRDELQNQMRQAAQQKQNGQPTDPQPAQQARVREANEKASLALEQAMEKFAPKVAGARENLAQLTPKLSELAKNTAGELKDSVQKTENAADTALKNQDTNQTAEQANALVPKAKEDAVKLADLQTALRQEADHANLNEEGQRQMARTADVALEQMRKQAPQITEHIQKAADSRETEQQTQSLQKAAQAQQQTAQALDQLAKNLAKMEQGQMLPEDALAAQSALEDTLGIKQPLDESYQRAEQLAEIMQKAEEDPQAALTALESELKRNPTMQRALGNLAEQTAQQSQRQMQDAQSQPAMAPVAAAQAATDTARVARHEQRLGDQQAAQKIAQASQQLHQTAQTAMQHPEQNTPQSAQQAAQAAQTAQQAASEAAKQQNAKLAASASFLEQTQAAMLAQALDQLDEALHPAMGQQEGQQQQAQAQNGQPQQQQGQQQGQKGKGQPQKGAQQSLSQANQAQAQSMADARAQGMVPGQQPKPQMSNNQQKQQGQPQGKNEGQQSAQENGSQQAGASNLIVPALAGTQMGDWGHLPSRMAKDLTEASRQEPSPEYRAAIESYYKAIANKAKK